ncbi:MAG: proprotein convertase P-domain-containing protein [Flavobacteriaceae bacterium]
MKRKLFFVLMLLPFLVFSQSRIGKVADEIVTQKIKPGKFQAYELFNTGFTKASGTYKNAVREGIVLDFSASKVVQLVNNNPKDISITLPINERGETVTLELLQNDIFSSSFNVRTSDGRDITSTMDRGKHYRGIVSGKPHSLVSLSIFNNEVMGFITMGDGNYVIGRLQDSNSKHIIYNDRDLLLETPLNCDTPDDGVGYTAEELQAPLNRDPGDVVCIYVEAGDSVFTSFGGNLTNTTNFLNGVFAQSYVIYANEGIAMQTSEMFIWTTADPYNGGNTSTQLSTFQAQTSSINGNLGHLVEVQNIGGLAAGFSGICAANVDDSLCFSGFSGTSFNTVPTFSFNVMIITHEMGHLLGSRHTHACVWNGNNTAIDGCAGFVEGSCPLPPSPPGGGTIMSYCHNDPVGVDFTQGFGPQPNAVIVNTVNTPGNCLIGTCNAPPANDLCANAQPMNCGDTVSGDTTMATFDNVGFCGTTNTAPGVWYSFTGFDGLATLSTCNQAAYDSKISVFTGSCGGLVCVGGNDDGPGCSGFTSLLNVCVTAGQTYYVLVHGFGSAVGTFNLTLTCTPSTVAITCPPTINVEGCGPGDAPAPYNSIAAFQAAGGTVTGATSIAMTNQTVSGSCPYTITRTYTATDGCGFTATCNQTIIVDDTTTPTITCPPDTTVECNSGGIATITGTDTASYTGANISWSDSTTGVVGTPTANLTGIPAGATITDVNVDIGIDHSWVGDLEIRLTSPDGTTVLLADNPGCGNTDNVNVTFDDAAGPFSCVGGVSTGTTSELCPGNYATNAAINGPMQGLNPLSVLNGETASGIWTLQINDTVGGDGGCIQVYSVDVSWEAQITVAGDPTNPAITGFATATDNCTTTISYTDASAPGCGNTQVITRTWTATDGCGNSASCNQIINVVDTTPPSISCPADVSLVNDPGVCGAALDFLTPRLVAIERGGGNLLQLSLYDANTYALISTEPLTPSGVYTVSFGVDFNPADGLIYAVLWNGSARTLVSIDPYNNHAITVIGNTNEPISDIAFDNNGNLWAITGGAAGANPNSLVTLNLATAASTLQLGGFPGGAKGIAYDWAANRIYTHTNTGVSNLSIINPVGPTVESTSGLSTNFAGATTMSVTNNGTLLIGDFASNWYSIDAPTGNVTGPVGASTLPVSFGNFNYVNSFDTCGSVTITSSPASGSVFAVGTTTVTVTSEDDCGNTSTCTFDVTVSDNEPPVAVCQNITVQLDASGNASIVAADVDGGSTDNCGIATLAVDIDTFDCSDVGPNNVVLTVTDVNGNSSQCTAIVTVEDNVPPVVSCPADIVANNDTGVCGAAVTYAPALATDACGIASVVQTSPDPNVLGSGDVFPVGTTTVTFTATDVNGNTNTCSFDITVIDNEDPVVACQNITVELDANGDYNLTPAEVIASATDNCGIASIEFADPLNSDFTECGPSGLPIPATGTSGNMDPSPAVVTTVGTVGVDYAIERVDLDLNHTFDGDLLISLTSPNGLVLDLSSGNGGGGDNYTNTIFMDGFPSITTGSAPFTGTFQPEGGPMNPFFAGEPVNGNWTLNITDQFGGDSGVLNNYCITFTSLAPATVPSIDLTCANVGVNTFTVIVTDVNGNTSSCETEVTVEDNIAPVIACIGEPVPVTDSVSDNPGLPFGASPTTITSTIDVTDDFVINDLDVDLDISHTWVGDIIVEIQSPAGTSVTIVDQPGSPVTVDGCPGQNMVVTLDDEATLPIEDECGAGVPSISGTFTPNNPLSAFDGESTLGTWTITVTDAFPALDDGVLNSWGLSYTHDVTAAPYEAILDGTTGTVTVNASDLLLSVDEACGYTVSFGAAGSPINECGDGLPAAIDENLPPTESTATVAESGILGTDYAIDTVTLDITHTFDGDLDIELISPTGTVLMLSDQNGGGGDNYTGTVFQDGGADITAASAPFTGTFEPEGGTFAATFAGEEINGGWVLRVTDNFGGDQGTLDTYCINFIPLESSTIEFTCDDLGLNQVDVTVTDASGNQSTCTATVNVIDNTDPILVCMDATVELDENGMAEVTPDLFIDLANSFDACGITITAVDVTDVTCDDIGTAITVTVFASDASGNLASCTATLTVVDLLGPTIEGCPADLTVDPGPLNLFYELPDYWAQGGITAVDNCTDPVTIFSQSPAPGTLLPDGVYTISICATDEYGNEGCCTFELTVESILGINDNNVDISTIVIYPNPAKAVVNISNPQSVDLQSASIYDLTGKLVRTYDLRGMGTEKTLNISMLASATYLVYIQAENGAITKQLIKE